MYLTADLSDEEVLPDLAIAEDSPGLDQYTLRIGSVELLVNWEQLQSLYQQAKPWFEEAEA